MEPQKNKPMSLEHLPQHLKSLKEKGGIGSPVLVDMGQIVVPQKKSYLKRILLAVVFFVGLSIGTMTYHSMSANQITVVMDVRKNADISKIVADSGGRLLSVEQIDNTSVYEVKIKTRKSKSALLEWLRGNRDVNKAELED